MSKIVQLGRYIFGPANEFIPTDVFNLPTKGLISLVNSIAKESKNMGTKILNKDILVNAGLNTIGMKIKKVISSIIGSGITLTNNKVEGIIKVIKSLENRRILLKGTTRKTTSQEGGFLNFLYTINDSWFTINEKCTYTSS